MLRFQSMISAVVLLLLQLPYSTGQTNQCTPTAIATCGAYSCVQTGTTFSCLCPDQTLKPNAAACATIITTTTTVSPVVIPNQCGNAVCPAGATCIPTNQNPSRYVCLCPNNVLGNPNCPTTPLANNPCLTSNPCRNGGTCVVNQLNLQAVCICPSGTYGRSCSYSCNVTCNYNW